MGIESTQEDKIKELSASLKALIRSASIVSDSLSTKNYVPEFRYRNFKRDITSARLTLKGNYSGN